MISSMHEIIAYDQYKYASWRRKFESDYSAALTISPHGLVGVAVHQLIMASALARVARWWKMVPAYRATAVRDSNILRGP